MDYSYKDYFSKYESIYDKSRVAKDTASNYRIASHIGKELEEIKDKISDVLNKLSDETDDTIVSFKEKINEINKTLDNLIAFANTDYVNAEVIYIRLFKSLEELKKLDVEFKKICHNKPDVNKYDIYNIDENGRKVFVKNDKYYNDLEKWKLRVSTLKKDGDKLSTIIDKYIKYLKSINIANPKEGATGEKIPNNYLNLEYGSLVSAITAGTIDLEFNKENLYNAKGSYSYIDDNGNVVHLTIKEESIPINDGQIIFEKNIYDENGNLVRFFETTYRSNDTKIPSIIHETIYDKNDEKAEETITGYNEESGVLGYCQIYKYHNGELESATDDHYDSDGKTISLHLETKYNEGIIDSEDRYDYSDDGKATYSHFRYVTKKIDNKDVITGYYSTVYKKDNPEEVDYYEVMIYDPNTNYKEIKTYKKYRIDNDGNEIYF